MGEINWALTIIIGSVFGIPFAILANLLTPRVQKWLDHHGLSNKNKRLSQLQKEYTRIKAYSEDHELLKLSIASTSLRILSFSISAVVLFFSGMFILVLKPLTFGLNLISQDLKTLAGTIAIASAAGIGMMVVKWASSVSEDIWRVISFSEYESEVTARIAELIPYEARTSPNS